MANSLSRYFKSHFFTIGVFAFIICSILAFSLPWLFTQTKISFLDFSNTGQIGDTIGGTLGPFIAWIAAFLTYLAFWAQFKANEQQRLDIKTERFENQFYKILDIIRQNEDCIKSGIYQGKPATEELLGEYFFIYALVCSSYKYLSKKSKVIFSDVANSSVSPKDLFLVRVAYGLFYYGKMYQYERLNEDNSQKYNNLRSLADSIKKNVIAFSNQQVIGNIDYRTFMMSDNLNLDFNSVHYRYKILLGHNDTIGIYFRQLFQLIEFISMQDETILSEEEKYNHVKIVRAQMSEFEQALLFYNSLSDFGSSWNIPVDTDPKNVSDMGYIARYRLLRNIPSNIYWYGPTPVDFYKKESNYWYNKRKKHFIERELLFIADGK